MNSGEDLLVGPYGRALCVGLAQRCVPDPDGAGWRSTDQLVASLSLADPERIAGLGEQELIAELESVVNDAVYWQEPRDLRKVWARPEVVDALRPIAEAVARNPATAWWSGPVDRSGQTIVRYWFRDWDAQPQLIDRRPALQAWRSKMAETEHRRARERNWRSVGGQWWSDPAHVGSVWTTSSRPGFGPIRLYTTEDSLSWTAARAHAVNLDHRARILEISGPEDWARLVDQFPLEVTHGRRGDWWRTTGRAGRWWIPDWVAVADEFDAVHVTVTGYLATAGWAVPTASGATVFAGWGPDHSCWLRPDRLRYTGVVEQWMLPRPSGEVGPQVWRRVPSEGPDGAMELSPLDDNATALLAEATRLNANWTGEERFTDADVAAEPTLFRYTQLRAQRGDFGIVARVGERAVGVVWLQFPTEGDRGYGYVADDVPELSVCAWPGYRGYGVGGSLLDAAIREARTREIRRISLSVEEGNPARRLYRHKGFVDARDAAPGTMVLSVR